MYILHVFLHVKADQVESFKQASLANAESSTTREKGCVRFDVLQQVDDPTRFTFVEVYRTKEDGALHKETPHYNHWRETAEPMLAEPRTRAIFSNLFPDDAHF